MELSGPAGYLSSTGHVLLAQEDPEEVRDMPLVPRSTPRSDIGRQASCRPVKWLALFLLAAALVACGVRLDEQRLSQDRKSRDRLKVAKARAAADGRLIEADVLPALPLAPPLPKPAVLPQMKLPLQSSVKPPGMDAAVTTVLAPSVTGANITTSAPFEIGANITTSVSPLWTLLPVSPLPSVAPLSGLSSVPAIWPAPPATPPGGWPAQITDKPLSDSRSYQFTVLPNGLQVLNIHDPKSLKSAFAMAVRAGSYDNPVELPGLAHFCEHMLFLGTEKFPEPSGFDKFMSKNGGSNNAYTASEKTVYYAELSAGAAEEGLDRFADFFRAPLFNKTFVEKEVHAIDSEHAKNKQDSSFRVIEVIRHLANPDSMASKFQTGDKETLYDEPKKRGENPVDALEVYFKNRYCPAMMKLVTFGPEPLEQQLGNVTKDLSSMPEGPPGCKGNARNFSQPPAWPKKQNGKWITIRGTQPEAQLWVFWTLPDVSKEFLSSPFDYLDYVLGYDGVDSLTRVLQDSLDLVTAAHAYVDMDSTGTQVCFHVTLTELGTKEPLLVLDVLYAYLAAIRRNGVDTQLYQSIADIQKLRWDWQEPGGPSGTASSLASSLTEVPWQSILSANSRIDVLNPSLVESLLSMLNPSRMNVAYVNPNATKDYLFKDLNVSTLAHYGVEYAVQEFWAQWPLRAAIWSAELDGTVSAAEIQAGMERAFRHRAINAEGLLIPVSPKPIQDVPKHIPQDNMRAASVDAFNASLEALSFGPQPRLQLTDEAGSDARVWYRAGWVTKSPKASIRILLRPYTQPTDGEVSAVDVVRLLIYSRLLAEEMEPKMVDLTATGVWYQVVVDSKGLEFAFGGFTPSLPRLVDTLLAEFTRFNSRTNVTTPSRFQRVKENMRQNYATYDAMPVIYALQDLDLLRSPDTYSQEEMLMALGTVDLEAAATSVTDLLLSQPLQLTALAMGNLAEHEASAVVDRVMKGLNGNITRQTLRRGRSGRRSRNQRRNNASLSDAHSTSSSSFSATEDLPARGQVEYIERVAKTTRPIEVRGKNPRPSDPNDVVVTQIVAGVPTVAERVELWLLGKILGVLAYDELRTERQLGYIVSGGYTGKSNVNGIMVAVQGTKLSADEVEAAIEFVLQDLMPKHLQNLGVEEFESYKKSLREDILQLPMAASQEMGHFWQSVEKDGKCFEVRSAMIQYLNTSLLTPRRLQEKWASLVLPAEEPRMKLTTKLFAKKVPERPDLDEAKQSWQKMQLAPEAIDRLTRERRQTLVLDKANSTARQKLVEEGGFFPQVMHCNFDAALG